MIGQNDTLGIKTLTVKLNEQINKLNEQSIMITDLTQKLLVLTTLVESHTAQIELING